jgi:hypothetical protein
MTVNNIAGLHKTLKYNFQEDFLKQLLSQCLDKGWITHDFDPEFFGVEDFSIAVHSLGTPLTSRYRNKAIEILQPTPKEKAHQFSQSRSFGLSEIPFHTDCAHWKKPPRFLILYCLEDTQNKPTTLLSWKDMHEFRSESTFRELADSTFLVRNGRNSYYSSLFWENENFCRIDFNCMIPATKNAHLLKDRLIRYIQAKDFEKVYWKTGRLLIVDNWSVLHGRGDGSDFGKRSLARALLNMQNS